MIPTEDYIITSIFSTYYMHKNKNIQKILTHQEIKSLKMAKKERNISNTR